MKTQFDSIKREKRYKRQISRQWDHIKRGRSTLRLTSPVVGSHSPGRFTFGGFCRVCLGAGDFLRPQGASPRLYSLRGVWVYCLVPAAPLIRGMLTGPKVFLAMLDACELCPETGPTLKRSCATFDRWWDG